MTRKLSQNVGLPTGPIFTKFSGQVDTLRVEMASLSLFCDRSRDVAMPGIFLVLFNTFLTLLCCWLAFCHAYNKRLLID